MVWNTENLAFYEMFCMQHTLLRDKIIFFEEWNGLEGVQNAIPEEQELILLGGAMIAPPPTDTGLKECVAYKTFHKKPDFPCFIPRFHSIFGWSMVGQRSVDGWSMVGR